ncbi:MAG: peptidylprolyl isomerase [Planctomycetaceae bacterium]|nr:peptidylprolyl isomerase [Planctomycetaceae bacterium]
MNRITLAATCALFLLGCVAEHVDRPATSQSNSSSGAGGSSANGESAETFQVKFETSRGDFVVEIHPDWAPNGASHFRELVENKFYDDCRFFRVVSGFMAQFGINGDPAMNKTWGDSIQDDKVIESNSRGMLTYAQTGMPNSRSTQLFISYGDNSFLDGQRFAPFGRVVEGMAVVDQLYAGYGDGPPMGNGPDQGRIESEGNRYLLKDFPKLDYIKTARIIEAVGAEAEPASEPAKETSAAEPPAESEQPAEATPAAE